MKPDFQKHLYGANDTNHYFEKISAPVGFIKLPFDFKLEPPIREDYQNIGVRFILKSRQINGKHLFQTGLIQTSFKNWFFGDHYHPKEKIKNSFCLFRFNEASTEITVYYFNHFKLYPKQREQFISQFVKTGGI